MERISKLNRLRIQEVKVDYPAPPLFALNEISLHPIWYVSWYSYCKIDLIEIISFASKLSAATGGLWCCSQLYWRLFLISFKIIMCSCESWHYNSPGAFLLTIETTHKRIEPLLSDMLQARTWIKSCVPLYGFVDSHKHQLVCVKLYN